MSKLVQAQIQRYVPLPIEGLKNPVVSVISPLPLGLNDLSNPDYFLQFYNEEDVRLLPLRDVVKVANAVQSRKPSEQFIDYARKNTGLTEETIINGYKRLHTKIWEGLPFCTCRMRAREILMWVDPQRDLQPMTIGYNIPDEICPYLVRDYKKIVVDREAKIIEPSPIIRVNWSIERGTITPQLAKLLGVPKDTRMKPDSIIKIGSEVEKSELHEYIITHDCTGLRALEILFSLTDNSKSDRPVLFSSRHLWDVEATGFLLEIK